MTVQSDGGGSVVIHVLLYWFVLMQCERVKSEPTQEKQALLAFISQLPHANRLQWNESDSPCNWVGVQCDPTQSYVSTLRLPGVGLVGPIPDNTLGNLTHLRVISIRSNALSGTLPSDFSNLRRLHSLYLQKNRFSGEFPPSLTHLTRLTRLDLSANNFSGEIPSSINNLTKLTGLFMANNKFSGSIPFINLTRLADLNISNNNFNGSIPTTLKKYPQSAFTGNIDLCGGPLSECEPNISSPSHSTTTSSSSAAPPPPHKQSNKLSTGRIIAIAGGAAAFVVLVVIIFLIIYLMKTRREKEAGEGAGSAGEEGETGSSMSRDDSDGRGLKRNRLIFISDQSSINGVVCKFELDDLLKASAEMLGKGSYGASYKAELDEETTVAVKRLKDATVSEKDFEAQVEVLGSIRHENVVPLRAFYYAQNERLLIYDYMPAGSLSNLLHGSKVTGRPPPNWETRVKIALTTAKGLAHLHASGKIVHGNIKSSNILLHDTEDPEAAITDYGLNTFFSSSSTTPAAHDHHKKAAGGYRAPEVLETRKSTVKSDVYSFGVLLLELLTGKSPCQQTSMGEEGIDLPRWVQSVVREEWASEVFDMDLVRYEDVEEEMMQLLQIAMTCVATVPDQRPAMLEVVRLIEDTVGNGDPLISIIP